MQKVKVKTVIEDKRNGGGTRPRFKFTLIIKEKVKFITFLEYKMKFGQQNYTFVLILKMDFIKDGEPYSQLSYVLLGKYYQ